MSRYTSSSGSRRRGSCGAELRLFFTPGEVDEQRREQEGAVAQVDCLSLFRFMEAASAPQGATTMAPRTRHPACAPAEAFASPALALRGREAAAQEPEEGPAPRRLPRSLPTPPRNPRHSPGYGASCRGRCPQPTPSCPQPTGGAEVTGLPGVTVRAPPPLTRTQTPLRKRLGTTGRGLRGPWEGCSVALHSQKKGPQLSLGARRLRPLIGRQGVTSRKQGLSTG
ncbi:hypothetical protein P7K49_032102, partial [Saguinus oedipus]